MPAAGQASMKTVLLTLLAAGLLALGAATIFIGGGFYDVSATEPHTRPVYALLETTMRRSVKVRAAGIVPPPMDDAAIVSRGAACYREHCLQCHGGPGVPHDDIAKGLQPLPDPLAGAVRQWRTRELYWIVRHGIKMSGMPAWEFHLNEHELWSVVAFIRAMPALSAPDYAAMVARPSPPAVPEPPERRQHGDAERGRVAITQYACAACHMIPGITGSKVYVGRPLKDLAARKYIAGHLPNTQQNLVRWIRDPQQVDPQTAMPMLGVSERDALDISAYLLKH
jgi:mono/diheme cytochrome c family protein